MTRSSGNEVVVVLTGSFDPSADRVIERLNHRSIPVFRCDPAAFPQRLTMTATLGSGCWTGHLRTEHREVALGAVRSVYYRRPGRVVIADDMPPEARRFAEAEARYGFGGVIAGLDCFWLNHPARIADAEYKPWQLQVARECGLAVPNSLITNDPTSVRAFVDDVGGRVVYKPLSGFGFSAADGKPAALFTSPITVADSMDPRIERTAHLFQEWVPKQHDVRLTAVGQSFFAVIVDVQGSKAGIVDWRADYASHRYVPTETPQDVRRGVRALLARLGLAFGAFDFAVTPEGEWVFLEVNPNGQWGWIEAATDLTISGAIADALEQGLVA
jgi:ATP-grasp ribosomal peptide maturase